MRHFRALVTVLKLVVAIAGVATIGAVASVLAARAVASDVAIAGVATLAAIMSGAGALSAAGDRPSCFEALPVDTARTDEISRPGDTSHYPGAGAASASIDADVARWSL